MISSYPPCQRAAVTARHLDRAGNCDAARPVPSHASEGAKPGHFQSDSAFAPAWLELTQAANRRSDRIINRVMIAIAATGALWVCLPAICAVLAGATPA